MNASEVLFLALGILALLGGGYFLYTQQPTQQLTLTPVLEWDVPAAVNVNEFFSVSLKLSQANGQIIILQADGNQLTQACEGDPCRVEFPMQFGKGGLHSLKVRLGKLEATRMISVNDAQSLCIDGTHEGECSNSLKQCVSGKLVDNCDVCGCRVGAQCLNHMCVVPTPHVLISSLSISLPTASTLSVTFPLENDSSVALNGVFLLRMDIYDNADQLLISIPQQIRLDALAPAQTQNVRVEATLPLRAARVGGKLFSVDAEGDTIQAIGTTTQTYPLTGLATDTISPGAPLNFHLTNENGQAVLNWDASPSSDVVGYVVYRQNFGSQAFTTYETLAQVTGTRYVLPSSAQTSSYTLRAKDASGNLSEPLSPISVPGNGT